MVRLEKYFRLSYQFDLVFLFQVESLTSAELYDVDVAYNCCFLSQNWLRLTILNL